MLNTIRDVYKTILMGWNWENVLFEEEIGEEGLSFYECVCVVYVLSFYFGEWNKLVSRTNGTEIGWKWSK